MPADTTGKALQLLDLMLEFFADDHHWARGRYHDRGGRHCLIGAVFYFSARHELPRAPVLSLLEAALPGRQIGLIAFNDRLCRSAAELRSVILKARAVALENAKHEWAAAAFKCQLLAELDRDRAVRKAARDEAPAEMYMPARRLPAESYPIPPSLIRQPSRERFRPVALPGQLPRISMTLEIRSRRPLSTPQRPFASIDSNAGLCPHTRVGTGSVGGKRA